MRSRSAIVEIVVLHAHPHLFADKAIDARLGAKDLRGPDRVRLISSDLENELASDSLVEATRILDRNDEGCIAANDAILVIDVEVAQLEEAARVVALEHDG